VMSPIYSGHYEQQFIFSSVKNDWAVDLLPEGHIFCLNPADLTWTVKDQFPFYSPYRLGN